LVDIEKLQDSCAFIVNSMGSSFEKITQIDETASLGIPLACGLSAGFAIGLAKG